MLFVGKESVCSRYPLTANESVGNGGIPRQHFVMRCHTFASSRANVTDDKRSGSRSSSQPEVNTALALNPIHTDRRVTLWLMAFDLALSNSSMRHIVVAVLDCSHIECYLRYDFNAMIRYDTIRYDTHDII